MNELQDIVDALASTDGAFGAIVCDETGESVVHAIGPVSVRAEAIDAASALIPSGLSGQVEIAEFLLRVAGAEPCALLASFREAARHHGIGAITRVSMRFHALELSVRTLPEDYYVVLVRARDAAPVASRALDRAGVALDRALA